MSIKPFVLGNKEELPNPEKRLRELCDQAKIPWDKSMLSWEAGARPEDGVWASYWYTNVHRSTGFGPYKENPDPFPGHLTDLLKESERFYSQLISM